MIDFRSESCYDPSEYVFTGLVEIRQIGICKDVKMFDYERYFNQYCDDNQLNLLLSFHMPVGYETANGTFDAASKTVFINAAYMKEAPDYEKAFYFFHELRHASQYLCPKRFSKAVNRSIQC